MRPLVVNALWPHRRSPSSAHGMRRLPARKMVVAGIGLGVVIGPFLASLGTGAAPTWSPTAASVVERMLRLAHPGLSSPAAVCAAAALRRDGFTPERATAAISNTGPAVDAEIVRVVLKGCRTSGQR